MLNFLILKEPNGFLKLLLILFSMISFAAVTGTKESCRGTKVRYDDIDDGEFIVAIMVLIFVFQIVVLGLYIFVMDKLQSLPFSWWILEMSLAGSFALLALVSSSLFAKGISDAKDKSDRARCDIEFAGWEFGAAMGFFTCFVLIASLYYLFKEVRDAPGTTTKPTPGSATTTTVVREETTVSV
eukprot:m.111164 g.111164  ORF g.111164 m.111164 type:complete len:184 (-) comp22762_c0_seq1:251-802(-)